MTADPPPTGWMLDAACIGTYPEAFFSTDTGPHRASTAESVCARCPVMDACLDYALRTDAYGVWGGTTRDQRSVMRKANR